MLNEVLSIACGLVVHRGGDPCYDVPAGPGAPGFLHVAVALPAAHPVGFGHRLRRLGTLRDYGRPEWNIAVLFDQGNAVDICNTVMSESMFS